MRLETTCCFDFNIKELNDNLNTENLVKNYNILILK